MRVLLLMPTTTYRAQDLLQAAERLGVEVVVGSDRRQVLESLTPGHTWTLDFARPERCVAAITGRARQEPIDAVIGLDDETTLLAAMAAEALGHTHNPPRSVRSTRNKYESRRLLAEAGRPGPRFRRVAIGDDPAEVARQIVYPCVLKPLCLSASRGVLRADDVAQFVEAFDRIVGILGEPDVKRRDGDAQHLLVEDFLAGPEVAVEGLLTDGRLELLALFDKPDPLDGPTFEETLYVTPSRLDDGARSAVVAETAAGCRALGLCTGPVHAELRLSDEGPWIVEVAARTIGGLCSRALSFGTGVSLEELVLRHALGLEVPLNREPGATGVMMIPIPRAGILQGVHGIESARATPNVVEVTMTAHRGAELVPLPEGHRYLGFVFARADTPDEVERSLREAHAKLRFEID